MAEAEAESRRPCQPISVRSVPKDLLSFLTQLSQGIAYTIGMLYMCSRFLCQRCNSLMKTCSRCTSCFIHDVAGHLYACSTARASAQDLQAGTQALRPCS